MASDNLSFPDGTANADAMLVGMDQQPEPSEKPITVSADTSGFVDGLWKVRAAMLFAWNPELVELDDELDIMYRGQL